MSWIVNIVEACTRETSGSANQTSEMEVDPIYTNSFAIQKQALGRLKDNVEEKLENNRK